MHGLIPGSDLFTSQLAQTYSLFFALLVGNVIILLRVVAQHRLCLNQPLQRNFSEAKKEYASWSVQVQYAEGVAVLQG